MVISKSENVKMVSDHNSAICKCYMTPYGTFCATAQGVALACYQNILDRSFIAHIKDGVSLSPQR